MNRSVSFSSIIISLILSMLVLSNVSVSVLCADETSVPPKSSKTQVSLKASTPKNEWAHSAFVEISRAEIDKAFDGLQASPRLLLNDEALDHVRRVIESSPCWQAYFEALQRDADKRANAAPVERKLEGKRLLGVSREALARIFGWSFLYRYTGDVKYAQRVEKEAIAISEFSDWNPSHFLDVAEMSVAIAIGYDTCKETFSDENRDKIRAALLKKGLKESLKGGHSWEKNTANWNQVCWCGTLFAALALADDEPEMAREAVFRAVNGVTWSMSSYEPDGNYTEGPGYWGYGTSFNVLLVAALNSSLNNDFGRSDSQGFLRSIQYYEHVFGTTGLAFNYPDSGGGRMFEPTTFWFAQKLGNSVVRNENIAIDHAYSIAKKQDSEEARIAAKQGARSFESLVRERLAVAALLWSPEIMQNKEVESTNKTKDIQDTVNVEGSEAAASTESMAAIETLGYVGIGNGRCCVALFRTDWKFDAAYLGIKAGAPNSPHGHMDEGGFVFDDGGVRWIAELGPENYNRIESRGMNLWNNTQNSDRWKLFRYNNFGHSVPTINGMPQCVDGLTKFIETKIGAPGETSSATIDLTPVYRDELKSAMRKATLEPNGVLTIEDTFEAASEKEANIERRFVVATKVDVLSDSVVVLTAPHPLDKNGEPLKKIVSTTSNVPTKWNVLPAETENDFDSKNPRVSILSETAKLAPGQKAVFTTTFSTQK